MVRKRKAVEVVDLNKLPKKPKYRILVNCHHCGYGQYKSTAQEGMLMSCANCSTQLVIAGKKVQYEMD